MAKRGGFPGGMGGFGGMNIGNLMKEAKKMQADMEKTQTQLTQMQSIKKAITFVSTSGLTPETNISQNLIRKETVITVKYIQ